MADSEDENPFVTGHAEEGAVGPATVASPPPDDRPPHPAGEEAKGDVAGLVPLCARHAEGPLINSAVFGYDIAQMQKRPWDDPTANLKDYFNYGFNETSWRLYCAMQAEGEASLLARANNFLVQLNGSAMKSNAVEETVGGDGAPYYMQPQGSSHAYYGGAPRDNFLKTKLCQRFLEGRCVKGEHCSYAHGHGELRTASHMHHHQHHHQQLQQQQQQPHQPPSYIFPSFNADQGVLLQMGVPPTGVLDPDVAGNYRTVPKRQRSSDDAEGQAHETLY